jgi:hypothetical protein
MGPTRLKSVQSFALVRSWSGGSSREIRRIEGARVGMDVGRVQISVQSLARRGFARRWS